MMRGWKIAAVLAMFAFGSLAFYYAVMIVLLFVRDWPYIFDR
jgi:hypothetical protein